MPIGANVQVNHGTDNNYVEYYHSPQTGGSFGLTKNIRTSGGTSASSLLKDFGTPIPWLTLYLFANGTLWTNWSPDFYIQAGGIPFYSIAPGSLSLTWTPSRVGFIINIATASSPYLYAILDAWSE